MQPIVIVESGAVHARNVSIGTTLGRLPYQPRRGWARHSVLGITLVLVGGCTSSPPDLHALDTIALEEAPGCVEDLASKARFCVKHSTPHVDAGHEYDVHAFLSAQSTSQGTYSATVSCKSEVRYSGACTLMYSGECTLTSKSRTSLLIEGGESKQILSHHMYVAPLSGDFSLVSFDCQIDSIKTPAVMREQIPMI